MSKMGCIIMLSGPIGAGKSTVAGELAGRLADSVAFIEGDLFWRFIKKSPALDRRENFRVIARSMTAAAVPFARSGYAVVLDFSLPPEFLKSARAIVKDVPLYFVMIRPSAEVCAERARSRDEGRIVDYTPFKEFYALFAGHDQHAVEDDTSDAATIAVRIMEGFREGKFRVPAG